MFQRSRGFTLIEMLVVVAIIGILAGIVLTSLGSARGKARDARRMLQVRDLKNSLEAAYDVQDGYPWGGNVITSMSELEELLNARGVRASLPTDDSLFNSYGYVRMPNGYGLLVQLENGTKCRTGQDMDRYNIASSYDLCAF